MIGPYWNEGSEPRETNAVWWSFTMAMAWAMWRQDHAVFLCHYSTGRRLRTIKDLEEAAGHSVLFSLPPPLLSVSDAQDHLLYLLKTERVIVQPLFPNQDYSRSPLGHGQFAPQFWQEVTIVSDDRGSSEIFKSHLPPFVTGPIVGVILFADQVRKYFPEIPREDVAPRPTEPTSTANPEDAAPAEVHSKRTTHSPQRRAIRDFVLQEYGGHWPPMSDANFHRLLNGWRTQDGREQQYKLLTDVSIRTVAEEKRAWIGREGIR